MDVQLIFFLVALNIFGANAGYFSNCYIENFTSYEWMMGSYRLKPIINDTYIGTLATLKTENVTGITVLSGAYLNATLNSGILTLFTTEKFKRFEEETNSYYDDDIIAEVRFECSDKYRETVRFRQQIKDINNHDPTFSREVYEYNIGMNIAENFDFSQLLPIFARDIDFTNRQITFSFDSQGSKNFAIKKEGTRKNNDYKTYYTTLTALKNITGSFTEEFVILATDGGSPSISKTAKVIINIVRQDDVFPTIEFSKSLYYANYTENGKLILEENVKLSENHSLGAKFLKQTGYTNNFKATFDQSSNEVTISVTKALEPEIFKNNFLVINLNAYLTNSTVSDHTTILIHLPKQDSINGDIVVVPNPPKYQASIVYVCNDYNFTTLVVLFFSIFFIIVAANIFIFAKFFKKHKNESKC